MAFARAAAGRLKGVTMRLVVNGEEQEIEAVDACGTLCMRSSSPRTKVATALNGEFVPARAREATSLKDGDRIEILAPRQGG